jgi:hypothetical protein
MAEATTFLLRLLKLETQLVELGKECNPKYKSTATTGRLAFIQ